MCNKVNLPSRIEKARAAVHFAKVAQYENGNVKVVIVPGSESKQYHVILRREGGKLSSEVNLLVNSQIIAPAWQAQHISYHAMAAVEVAATAYKVTWFANEDDARRYSRFGGQVHRLYNHNNYAVYEWFVIQKKE